jgi:hypothetical protein
VAWQLLRHRHGDREREADEFYAALAPDEIGEEEMRVLRQSCAGLIWSKQMYPYRVARWLDGDPGSTIAAARASIWPQRGLAAP